MPQRSSLRHRSDLLPLLVILVGLVLVYGGLWLASAAGLVLQLPPLP